MLRGHCGEEAVSPPREGEGESAIEAGVASGHTARGHFTARSTVIALLNPRALLAALVALLGFVPAAAQPVRDNFAGAEFSPAIWFVCHRPENAFGIVPAPELGLNAAQMVVRHPDLGRFTPSAHRGCRPDDGLYDPGDGEERAELWEADALKQPFGTEIWTRFRMWIDPKIPAGDATRLVIGQWKEDGGHSPMLAQRFTGRRFTITIGQDNDDPARDTQDVDCRVIIAHDAAFGIAARAGATGEPTAVSGEGAFLGGSLGYDRNEVVHGVAVAPGRAPPCARDILVTGHRLLPEIFGRWTTMLYHIKAAVDGNGLVELWADGDKIVTVTGRIGFRDAVGRKQYFKFGPYRRHAPYPTLARLATYARGATREEVE
jgi:hypothetical protein